MTTTLITGKGGTPHVTSGDMGAMQAGVIGNGSYLLQGSDGTFPTVTMQDANHALIPVLNLVVEGRYARVTEAETATIESGVSGQNRNDLVCLKYTRNDQNIETAAIAVLKGTPNTGTAADPTVPSGSIHSASGTAWIPVARIPLSGITPGTPVMLIKQIPPLSELWDSATLYKKDQWTILRKGRVIVVKFEGSIGSGSWDSVTCPVKLAEQYRPPTELTAACTVWNGQTSRILIASADGTLKCANMGAAGSNDACSGVLIIPF